MAAPTRSLSVYRAVLKELRTIYKQDKDSPAVRYFKEQFRRYEVTSEMYCRGQTEMEHMAGSYLCLLQSIKKHDELTTLYKGAGERSQEQAAKMVGLSLPETYQEPQDEPK